MQDDRALTFQQIHGNKEALLAAVKDIERIALVESYEIGSLRLRFLQPYPQGGSEFDYVLTPARELWTNDLLYDYHYITVSYVWTHSQPIDGIELPEYRIWDGADLKKYPRLLRCPPIVFHRVVQFTKTEKRHVLRRGVPDVKTCKVERIWIDQECIDQTDPNDVEKHLQDMHRIYHFSVSTVAVLSKVSASWVHLSKFTPEETLRRTVDEVNTAEETLREMTEDPWFTRSWTFHEQYCAGEVAYLLPRPTLRHQTLGSPEGLVATSVSILEKDIVVHDNKMKFLLFLCAKGNKFFPALESRPLVPGKGTLRGRSRDPGVPYLIENAQKMMENRENQVLSDRLQIIANACSLGWKLKTTVLNTSTQSYSTCLLALTMANTWPDPAERAYQYQAFGDAFTTGGIEGAIEELMDAQ